MKCNCSKRHCGIPISTFLNLLHLLDMKTSSNVRNTFLVFFYSWNTKLPFWMKMKTLRQRICYSHWTNGAWSGVISIWQWGVFNHEKSAVWQSHLAAQKEGVITTIIFSNHKTYQISLGTPLRTPITEHKVAWWEKITLQPPLRTFLRTL